MSRNPDNYNYLGDIEYQPGKDGYEDVKGRLYFPYRPDDELIEAVNLAIALERPLLLEGEPGCGKTCLAGALAYEWSCRHLEFDPQQKDTKNQKFWPFYVWNIKSSTQYRDGLYKFDAVLRLRDAQMLGADPEQLKANLPQGEYPRMKERLGNTERYVNYGELGEALRQKDGSDDAWMNDYRPIVLIDEIDKADNDFANDLLRELDNFDFDIPELNDTQQKRQKAKVKPIIIITSNRERPLPEPFLRRCVYYYLPFPEKRVNEIIELRFGEVFKQKQTQQIVQTAIERFYQVQGFLSDQPGKRSPGLSEFLDFLRVLLEVKKDRQEALKILKTLSQQKGVLGTLIKSQDMIREFQALLDDE